VQDAATGSATFLPKGCWPFGHSAASCNRKPPQRRPDATTVTKIQAPNAKYHRHATLDQPLRGGTGYTDQSGANLYLIGLLLYASLCQDNTIIPAPIVSACCDRRLDRVQRFRLCERPPERESGSRHPAERPFSPNDTLTCAAFFPAHFRQHRPSPYATRACPHGLEP
jgi:hypothetical protein